MESGTVDMNKVDRDSRLLKSPSPSPSHSALSDFENISAPGTVDKKSVKNRKRYVVPSLSDYLESQLPSRTNSDAARHTSERSVSKRQKNRQRVLDAIEISDCTQARLQEQLGLGAATVSRWLSDLLDSKLIHICKYEQQPHGGPQTAIYRFASGKGRRTKRPAKKTDMQRVSAYRKRMRRSGEWEHTLAKRRATYRANNPRPDPLSAAFFGLTLTSA